MKSSRQQFGGNWTEEKLERVRKYLVAYATIMSKQPFRFAYIDAFAGTGYRSLPSEEDQNELMFPELAAQDTQRFLDGSARIALQVRPRFSKYIFIEKDPERIIELCKLKDEFSELRADIQIEEAEANAYLQNLCSKQWIKHGRRAVLFLDPFGMQVQWKTIEAIAQSQAIDLWLLFPLGVAVNRLLRRDGQINQTWRHRLNEMFGTQDWFDVFYTTTTFRNLFGEQTHLQKVGNFDSISQYFVERLKTVFVTGRVVDNPLPLFNSRGNPLYLLCFAAGHPAGAKTAVKIAQDILKR